MKIYKPEIISLLLILLLSFLSFGEIFPQSTRAFEEISYLTGTSGVGTRSLGMGGAVIADVKDYSAMYWNPAGLTFAKSPQVYGSFSNFAVSNDAIFMNNLTSGRQSFTKFNSIGFMYPVPVYRGGLTVAAGYNRVEDFNSILSFSGFNSNPEDSVYQSEDVSEEGSLNNLSFSGAFEAAKGLSLGATLTYIHGKHLFSTFFGEDDYLNIYTFDIYNESRFIESRIKGFDLKVGMQYIVNRYFNIGAVISFPKIFFIEDEFEKSTETIYDYDIDGEPDYYYDTGIFKYRISVPFAFGLGASFNYSGFVISGDIEYQDLSQVRYLTDTPLEGLTKGQANMEIRRTVEPVLKKRVGIEFPVLENSVKLRAGYFENPNPLKFSVSENTKRYYTAGIGISASKSIELNFAYMRGGWEDKSIDDLVNIPVEEDRAENRVYAGILFKF
ncbi:MAG: hypothetical protein HWN67_19425 [Candidatus Helarchaeota archaeon]|nr:hypothetical protein [Candidatus Helarchaeota archaeon]